MKKFNWLEFTYRHNWAYNLVWWWRNGWVSTVRAFIYHAINDPYKNPRKCLPRFTWKDTDAVMEDVVFALFKRYCDEEDKNWNKKYTLEELYGQPIKEGDAWYEDMVKYRDKHNKDVDKMVEIYNYLETREKKWEEAFNYKDMTKESGMTELDTKYLTEIIKLRGGLWT